MFNKRELLVVGRCGNCYGPVVGGRPGARTRGFPEYGIEWASCQRCGAIPKPLPMSERRKSQRKDRTKS